MERRPKVQNGPVLWSCRRPKGALRVAGVRCARNAGRSSHACLGWSGRLHGSLQGGRVVCGLQAPADPCRRDTAAALAAAAVGCCWGGRPPALGLAPGGLPRGPHEGAAAWGSLDGGRSLSCRVLRILCVRHATAVERASSSFYCSTTHGSVFHRTLRRTHRMRSALLVCVANVTPSGYTPPPHQHITTVSL